VTLPSSGIIDLPTAHGRNRDGWLPWLFVPDLTFGNY
jgi:hypothetical protein